MKLQKDDKVAFIAPSATVSEKDAAMAAKWFTDKGFEVEIMPHVFSRRRYMAGADEERAADVNECFSRSDIRAIFCLRGGAGSLGVLDKIDYENVCKNPKPVFGLSDSTALQNALFVKSGNVSYTGFLPIYDLTGDLNEVTANSLKAVFAGEKQRVSAGVCYKKGKTRGIVVGGCLSVFCSLCGTPYFPNLKDKILLFEDIGEKTYRLERLLTQLSLQPGFSQIKGIVFGEFVNCQEANAGDGTIEEILRDFIFKVETPVLAGFPYGHQKRRYVLPIGQEVFLDADNCQLEC